MIRENGKQCMMQMPVKTTLRLYCDDSHLIPWVCEIISMYCDTVALLLSIVYYTAIIENYINLNDANACENYIAIYGDDSLLVSSVCEIIKCKCDTVALLLSIICL